MGARVFSWGGSHSGRAARLLAAAVTAVSLVLVGSCTVGDTPGAARETGQGSAEGVEFEVGSGPTTTEFHGITVSLPAGVAPVGTEVVLRREAQSGTRSPAVAVSDGLRVDLGDGLQPAQPVTLVFPLDRDELPAVEDPAQLLVVRSTSTDGQVRLHTGTYDAENATYTVNVDHLSNFQVFRLDLDAVLREVHTAVMQGLNLEYPKPDCVGQTATIDGVTYNVISPPQSWICLESDGDDLIVTASPNSAIPFVVTSQPSAALMTLPSDVTLATSTIITIARSLNFIGTGQAAVMPGAHAELRYQPAPDAATLTFEQYPVLLLMAILATTVETITIVLGIPFVLADLLNDLQCLGTVAATANRGVALDGETTGGVIRAFFDCVGPLMGDALGPAGVIITAILGAAPSYLIASLLGLVNVLTGQSRAKVTLDVQKPASSSQAVAPHAGVLGNVVAVDGTVNCQVANAEVFSPETSWVTETVTCTIPDAPADAYPHCDGPTTITYFDGQIEAYCGGDVDYAGAVPLLRNDVLTFGRFSCQLGPDEESIMCRAPEGGLSVTRESFMILPQ